MRALWAGVLLLAVVVVGALMLGTGGPYRVAVTLDNAGQLVKGNEVKVGGVPVGRIESIALTPDGRARLDVEIADGDLTPLHRGSTVSLRQHSLSGIANRYLALTPGPNDRAEIPAGGALSADAATPGVDLDQVLSALDPHTGRELQSAVRNLSGAVDGDVALANEGLEALNPALSQSAATAREIVRDNDAFERFLLESAGVVSRVASRPEDLDSLTSNALAATSSLAERDGTLASSIARLPQVLRQTNSSLVNLRSTVRELRPAVREARPVARPLTRVLKRLQPVTRAARPVVGRLRRTVRRSGRNNDLLEALGGLPGLAREAMPAFRSTDRTLRDAMPVVSDARPYTPDLVGGLLNGFGGATGGYYDANGHYARISFQASAYTLSGAGSLLELPKADGLTGYRKGVTRRCPGAATQSVPDGSNPYVERDEICDRGHSPR